MNKFSFYIASLVVACVTLFSSCYGSDAEYASISVTQKSVFFSGLNESMDIYYTGSNISDLEASDVPSGWKVVIDRSKKKVTFYGPTTEEDFAETETTEVTLTATSQDSYVAYAYITVGVTSTIIDLSSEQANSFMVTQPNGIYTFSALSKGEDQGSLAPSTVALLWQSASFPIAYVRLNGDNVEFYVPYDTNDIDGDEITTDLIEGNAVIAAYTSSGEILWSWHIWCSDFSAEDSAVTLNGVTLMNRNLGANANDNSSDEDIHSSYGLYYQWGRKDPFIRPYYYNATGATDGTMLTQTGSVVYVSYESSTSSRGKESYAIKNPLTFILGVEDSSYDWLYSAHSSTLWSEEKSINDPCPKGWRVASTAAYEPLKVPSLTSEELTAALGDYGWYMSDAEGNEDLFMGFGRRGYITGKVQNVNLNESRPEPWAGYYWCAEAAADNDIASSALFFAIDAVDISGNESMVTPHYRANGMQVRCQRDI